MNTSRFICSLYFATIFILAAGTPAQAKSGKASLPENVVTLLAQAKLELSIPDGYHLKPGAAFAAKQRAIGLQQQSAGVDYELALKSTDERLEIRISIRPLSNLQIDYNNPHGGEPDPNHLFSMMFPALVDNLSSAGSTPIQAFSHKDAARYFHAHSAMSALFKPNPATSPDFKDAFLLGLHRASAGDAYVLFLFNDWEAVKPRFNEAMRALQFREPVEEVTISRPRKAEP